MPIEIEPGLEWFDFEFGGPKLIEISYRITNYTSYEYRKSTEYKFLHEKTGRRVCFSEAAEGLKFGLELKINYFGSDGIEISSVDIDQSMCRNLKNIKQGGPI